MRIKQPAAVGHQGRGRPGVGGLRSSVRMLALGVAMLVGSRVPLGAQVKGLRVGDIAPTAIVQTLEGGRFDLGEIVGRKPALIEFWATWCPLCRQLEPTVAALHATYGSRLELVRIVVPQNQTPERAREYVAKHGLPGRFVFDADGAAYKAFAAYHTSYIVVLDRHGRVVHSQDGGTQELEAAIRKALQ